MRGATSRAGRAGCCSVLRGLVAGERCRGRPGRGWGSVGGLVPSQGQCGCLHVPLELVSGPGTCGWAAFCWLDRNFEVPGAFSAPQSAPLTQSSKRRLVGREHALPTLKCQCPCPPPSTRASTFSGFAQPPYNRATPALAFPRLAQPYTPAKKMLRPKSFFFRCGRPPRPTARPPGEPHWWRGRPSQQFARKDTFRAPRTGVLDRFGPLERELARPRTRALRTRSLRADVCLTRRSSQVNTRTILVR